MNIGIIIIILIVVLLLYFSNRCSENMNGGITGTLNGNTSGNLTFDYRYYATHNPDIAKSYWKKEYDGIHDKLPDVVIDSCLPVPLPEQFVKDLHNHWINIGSINKSPHRFCTISNEFGECSGPYTTTEECPWIESEIESKISM